MIFWSFQERNVLSLFHQELWYQSNNEEKNVFDDNNNNK